jgi:hypothetical protein
VNPQVGPISFICVAFWKFVPDGSEAVACFSLVESCQDLSSAGVPERMMWVMERVAWQFPWGSGRLRRSGSCGGQGNYGPSSRTNVTPSSMAHGGVRHQVLCASVFHRKSG